MKTILLALSLTGVCMSCKIGETDKAVNVNESEELNIGEKKHSADSSIIIDTLRRQ